jgi:hypothetical protein
MINRIVVAKELVKIAKLLSADDEQVREVVYNYIMEGSKRDVGKLRKLVDDWEFELKGIRQQIAGMDKLGSGKVEAQNLLPNLRKALVPLKTFVDTIDQNAKRFSR